MDRRAFMARLAGIPVLGRLLPSALVAAPAVPAAAATASTATKCYQFSIIMQPVISSLMTPSADISELLEAQPMTGNEPSIPIVYKAEYVDGKWITNNRFHAGVVKPE